MIRNRWLSSAGASATVAIERPLARYQPRLLCCLSGKLPFQIQQVRSRLLDHVERNFL
jgi:hypothetical protein